MAREQSAELERRKFFSDPTLVSMIVVLLILLALFILYPLFMLLVDSFRTEGDGVTLDAFRRVLSLERFQKTFKNTVVLGLITGFTSTAIGLLFAYVEVYVKLKAKILKKLFSLVSMLPVVSPSFMLSLSMIMLFGHSGTTTRSLLGIYDSNVHGLKGIAIVQTLTFFPVCYLMSKDPLKNIDPSLEEATRGIGTTRWKAFTSVTFPLLLPGLGNAFLVTFIESVADFANPILIGGSYDTLATTIYLQVTGVYDSTGAAAMTVVLFFLTAVLFLIQKYYLEKKTVATLTGKASHMRILIEDRSVTVPLIIFCGLVVAFVLPMYIMVPSGATFTLQGRDYGLNLKWFQYMSKISELKAFKDSFVLSAIAAPPTASLSMVVSYLVVKEKFKAEGFIEFVSMLAMAVPGTALGIGYIRGYARGLLGTGTMSGLYGSGLILIIVFIVRSLPTSTRSGISALHQISRSIEESAYDMGAGSAKVFITVTLPLIKDSFFSGLVTVFVRSITAIPAIILLVTPDFLLITYQINEQAEKGNYGVACAYATVLIIITYGTVLLIDTLMKFSGVSRRTRAEEQREEDNMEKQKKGVRLDHISKVYTDPKTGEEFYAVQDTTLDIEPGSFVTLLGPSGCGKTTTLRMIAGFESPDEGGIFLGDESINTLTPNKRDTATVFQSYTPLPHYNVFDNVVYGLKIRRLPKEEIHERVMNILKLVEMDGMESRMTNQLSGNQQQRMALARALVIELSALLLDEPLSNLDAKPRVAMKMEIREIQQKAGITAAYVAHDQSEVMNISDKVIIMSQGRAGQIGTPREVYYHPSSKFVADFIGEANFLDAKVKTVNGERAVIDVVGQELEVNNFTHAEPGAGATLVIRPEGATLAEQGLLEATVGLSTFIGSYQYYEVMVGAMLLEITDYNPVNRRIYEMGEKAYLDFDPKGVYIF